MNFKLSGLAACLLVLQLQSCKKEDIVRKPAAPGSLKQQDWLAGGTIADGIYEIYGPNYKCIQATDTGNGAKLQQNTYSGLGLQKWRVTAVGTGYYKIINYESNKAMDIPSGTPNTPAPTQNLQLQQWGYLGTNNQLWKIEYLGKWGLYKISSKGNGLVVTLNNNAKIQLEKITQTTFTADSAHVWFFKQAEDTKAVDSVSVDLSSVGNDTRYAATGFLNGFGNDGNPPDSLVAPLKPSIMRADSAQIFHQTERMQRLKIKQQLVVSAYWPTTTGVKRGDHPPGQINAQWGFKDWTQWENFVADNVSKAQQKGIASTLQFDIFNEADEFSGFWPYDQTKYPFPQHFYATWKYAYNKIRTMQPNAVIVGPSFKDHSIDRVLAFLEYAKANNVFPDIISFHFPTDIVGEVERIRQKCDQLGVTRRPIQVNEYVYKWSGAVPPIDEQYAGKTAWLIGQLERAKVDAGVHAIWVSPAIDYGQLGGIITKKPGFSKRGQWWVYKGYADITGKLLGTTPGKYIEVVAGANPATKQVRMLLGTNPGIANSNVKIKLSNISSMFIGKQVHIIVVKIPDNGGGAVLNTVPVYDKVVNLASNKLEFMIPWESARDAYTVRITQ